MAVLHIEHAITDLDTWFAAFNSFAERRQAAGVRHERVCRPVDDPQYILIDLDFDRAEQAQRFLAFLQETVWSSSANAPALAGQPTGRVLDIEHELHQTLAEHASG